MRKKEKDQVTLCSLSNIVFQQLAQLWVQLGQGPTLAHMSIKTQNLILTDLFWLGLNFEALSRIWVGHGQQVGRPPYSVPGCFAPRCKENVPGSPVTGLLQVKNSELSLSSQISSPACVCMLCIYVWACVYVFVCVVHVHVCTRNEICLTWEFLNFLKYLTLDLPVTWGLPYH